MTDRTAPGGYALVDVERRAKRASSPDSDPSALKAKNLDLRFAEAQRGLDAVAKDLAVHKTETGEKLDTLAEKLAETALEVARGTATLKAYLAAVVLFLTVINVGAAVLGKLVSAPSAPPPPTYAAPR